MLTLSILQRAILAAHPDELRPSEIGYLADPANAVFLVEYEATWIDVISTRRQRPNPQPTTPCSLSASS